MEIKKDKCQKKILIVEDKADLAQLYADKLKSEHFQVRITNNGIECLKLLAEEKFDIILLDLIMPLMSGFTVLEERKKKKELQDIPVVVFSVRGYQGHKERALELGATDYLVKTHTTPNDLTCKIKQILSQKFKEKTLPHYHVEIEESLYDAPKLAVDFNLPLSFKCPKCNEPLILELVCEDLSGKPEFRSHFRCLQCS